MPVPAGGSAKIRVKTILPPRPDPSRIRGVISLVAGRKAVT